MRFSHIPENIKKGCSVRNNAAVEGHAVGDGRHTELTNAKVDVIATEVSAIDRFGVVPDGEVRARQIRRTPCQLGQVGPQNVEGIA